MRFWTLVALTGTTQAGRKTGFTECNVANWQLYTDDACTAENLDVSDANAADLAAVKKAISDSTSATVEVKSEAAS